MTVAFWKKVGFFVVIFGIAWLSARYLLPIVLPFIFGAVIATAAEPAVALGTRKLSLPRWVCAGIGVSITLLLLAGLLGLMCSLGMKVLGRLANSLPNIQNTARHTGVALENWLTDLAAHSPVGLRTTLTNQVHRMFAENQAVAQRVSEKFLTTAENILSHIPGNALGLGVTLISAFMISRRLPQLKDTLRKLSKSAPGSKIVPALNTARRVIGKWLLAQLKLSSVTFGIVMVGLMIFGVRYAPFLALGIALVDALPVLGTGIILLPWGIVALIQGNVFLGIGLFCIYAAALITRTVLEPRLVGSHLGLDPLLTLLFLYCGFRLWGVAGMLLFPIFAAMAKCVLREFYLQKRQK